MPRVFITQLPSRLDGAVRMPTVDINPAREHGDLIFMVPMGANFPEASMALEPLLESLISFNEERDFLLPMGDPVVMACASAILGARMNSFKMLKWDRQTRTYISYRIGLQNIQKGK